MSTDLDRADRLYRNTAKLRGYTVAALEFHEDSDGKHRTCTMRMDSGEEFTGGAGEAMKWINALPDKYTGNFREDIRRMAKGERI